MGIASLFKKLSGRSTSVIYYKNCVNKAVLFSGNNYVHHINEEVFDSADGHTNAHPILYRSTVKIIS
jgi:hypothetical protein